MESITEDVFYQCGSIISNNIVEEQQYTENGNLFYWNINDENSGSIETESTMVSNEFLESLQAVNDVELTDEGNYAPIVDGRIFLKNCSTEDEYYGVIKPTLISRNYDEEVSNVSSYNGEEISTGQEVQLYNSEDSNSRFYLLNFENSSDVNLEASTEMFKCVPEGCENSSATSAEMKVSNSSTLFVCPVKGCFKKFTSHFSMSIHMKIHTGERLHMCNDCSKSFKSSSHLEKHAKIHTGVRPYSCPIKGCNRSFTTSNILKVHIRSHTGERPYACQHPGCGKAFTSQANMKNHQRIHSGEKPFACKIMGCKKRFTEYSTLYKHMYAPRHHKNVQLPDDLLLHISQSNEINFDDL